MWAFRPKVRKKSRKRFPGPLGSGGGQKVRKQSKIFTVFHHASTTAVIRVTVEYPPAQNQYMQDKILGELIFARIHVRGLYSHSRECRKIFWRHHFPHISEILAGLNVGANTCRACIRTRADTGKNSWRIIYVLVSCQGVCADGRHAKQGGEHAPMSSTRPPIQISINHS